MRKGKRLNLRQKFSDATQLVLFSVAAVAAWEAAVRIGEIPKYLVSNPSAVLTYMLEHPGYILYHSWITLPCP